MGCGASAQPHGDVPPVASAEDAAATKIQKVHRGRSVRKTCKLSPKTAQREDAARTTEADEPRQPAAAGDDGEARDLQRMFAEEVEADTVSREVSQAQRVSQRRAAEEKISLEEGVYMLENVLATSGMYLHIPGGEKMEEGTIAEISGDLESGAAKWKLILQAGTSNTYLLESALVAGKYLGVREASDEDGSLVEVCGDASAASAQWQVWPIFDEDTSFLLENVNATGKFLQVAAGGADAGCQLEINSVRSSTIRWRIPNFVVPSDVYEGETTDPVRRLSLAVQPAGSIRMEDGEMDELMAAHEIGRSEAEAQAGLYQIEKAEAPGKYLHLTSGGVDDGTSAEIYDGAEAGAIWWRVRLAEGSADVFLIENAVAGKYLHVAYGGSSNGDNVDIDCEIAPSSQWRIQPVEDMEECYTIENVNAEGMYLHVAQGGSNNGDNVEIYSDITASSAKWRIAGFALPIS